MGKKFIGITANSKSELIRQINNVAAQENLNNTIQNVLNQNLVKNTLDVSYD